MTIAPDAVQEFGVFETALFSTVACGPALLCGKDGRVVPGVARS